MRLKNKFRPNLPDASSRARVRRISGSTNGDVAKRIRTVSGSSNPPEKQPAAAAAVPKSPIRSPEPLQPSAAPAALPPLSPPPVAAPQTPKQPPAVHRLVENGGDPSPPAAAPLLTPPSPTKAAAAAAPGVLSPRTRHVSYSSDNDSVLSRSPLKRRLTADCGGGKETIVQPASVFDRRKTDHKKKFSHGVPERTKMTMFDLIYYNPMDGARMSNSSSRRTSRASVSSDEHNRSLIVNDNSHASSPVKTINEDNEGDAIVPDPIETVRKRLEEEAADDLNEQDKQKEDEEEEKKEEEEDDHDEAMPVPQVKVGPNGEIVIDEESTLIETTAAKKAKEDLLKSPLVFENANQATNYGSWGKKRKNVDWSDRETVRFYKALSVFGTDFSMMESVFKKRTRHDLKMKFKKEERQNRALVDRCLREGMQFDTSIFDSDSEEEEERRKQEEAKSGRRKKKDLKTKKKRVRKVKTNRGYYSSSDADESEVASETDSRRNSQDSEVSQDGENKPANSRVASTRKRRAQPRPNLVPRTSTSSPLLKSLLSKDDSASSQAAVAARLEPANAAAPSPSAFPPGLLAANPDLANAVPGSLVVVASPAENDPQKQMLHVYRVAGGKEKEQQEEKKAASAEENQEQNKEKTAPNVTESNCSTT